MAELQERPSATKPHSQANTSNPAAPTEPAYSIFSRRHKRLIISLVAFVGWFSSLSSFIYFPIITALATSLSTSISRINLTVTAYLAVSAVAPAVVGDLADSSGRRPVFLGMLGVYVVANVGLAVQRSYVALVILRMLQSAGISGAVAIAYGVAADIASPAERGGYVGILSFGMNTAPAIGPLLGALLLAFRGWTAVFWFMSIASGLCLLLVTFILPETARNIVGNGSIAGPSAIYRLPFSRMHVIAQGTEAVPGPRLRLPNPLKCLYVLRKKDTTTIIVSFSIFYMVYTCLQASLSSLFIEIYDLSQLQAGLIYLPFGVGCALAAFFAGKILDRDYRITAHKHGFSTDRSHLTDMTAFPIAKARLRSIPYPMLISTAAVAGYGWCLEEKSHIAIPLILQFLMGCSLQCCFTILSTLLTDINATKPSTAAASNNLIRCALAGLGLAVLQPLIDRVGVGWCFTIFAGACAVSVPLLGLLWFKGGLWRNMASAGEGEGGGGEEGVDCGEKRSRENS